MQKVSFQVFQSAKLQREREKECVSAVSGGKQETRVSSDPLSDGADY